MENNIKTLNSFYVYDTIKTMNMTFKKGTYIPILILLCLLIAFPASASVFLLNGTEVAQDKIPAIINDTAKTMKNNSTPLIFFYDRECQSCQQSLDFIRYFENYSPRVQITYYNLGYSKKNKGLFTEYKNRFNTTKILYPAIFAGDIVISGSSDIIHYTNLFNKSS